MINNIRLINYNHHYHVVSTVCYATGQAILNISSLYTCTCTCPFPSVYWNVREKGTLGLAVLPLVGRLSSIGS